MITKGFFDIDLPERQSSLVVNQASEMPQNCARRQASSSQGPESQYLNHFCVTLLAGNVQILMNKYAANMF